MASEQVEEMMPWNFYLASAGLCRAPVPNVQKVNLASALAYIVEGLTMHGMLVSLKNLFVRTEHDYITCMTW